MLSAGLCVCAPISLMIQRNEGRENTRRKMRGRQGSSFCVSRREGWITEQQEDRTERCSLCRHMHVRCGVKIQSDNHL